MREVVTGVWRWRALLAVVSVIGLLAAAVACGTVEPQSWRQQLAALDMAALREGQRARELLPYELIGRKSVDARIDGSESGWTHGGQPPLDLEPPIDWNRLRDENRSWNFQLHTWEPIDAVLARYSDEPNTDDLETCVAFALDWVRENPFAERGPQIGETFDWYDMAVGLRAFRLAYLIDVAARMPSVPDRQLTLMWGSMLDHFEYLEDDSNIRFHNNHGLYQAMGQLLAARRFSWLDPGRAISEQARNRLARMIDQQFTTELVHREHSPGYHLSVLDILMKNQSVLVGGDPSLASRLVEAEQALAWMVLPNNRLAMLGDTDRADVADSDLVAGYSSDLLRYAVSGGHRGAPSTNRVGVFPESGLAVLRSGWPPPADFSGASYLAQQCAFHSRTHKHADDLAFLWYDHGNEILIDPGRYGYLGRTDPSSELFKRGFWYEDPKRVYVESTRAHNTVEIDGQSYDRKREKPYGSAIERWGETASGVQFVECRVVHLEEVRHTRLLLSDPHRWLLVLDLLEDAQRVEHDFRQWFHFAPHLGVARREMSLEVTGATLPTLSVLPLVPGPEPGPLVRGQTEPELVGWWAPNSGVLEPAWSTYWQQRSAASATFATLFAFAENVERDLGYTRVREDGRDARFRWTQGDEVRTVTLKRPVEGDLLVRSEVAPRNEP